MEILERIQAYIEAHELFDPHEPILVAVSGGADSLCLLDSLHKLDYRVLAAHLDHQLRSDSAQDAREVGRICRRLEIPLVQGREDVSALAGSGRSIEEAARMVRYSFLKRAAIENEVQTIATGHTYDDQAETILMHFLRGAGSAGLRGMRPRLNLKGWIQGEAGPEIWLTRPLLPITRAQTLDYCRQFGLTPVEDPTNLDADYTRNRVRLELLPHLESFNPRIKANLNRLGELMAGIEALMEELVQSTWPEVVHRREDGSRLIRMPEFGEQPLALQREILREAISRTKPGLIDLGFEMIEAGREFILLGKTGARRTLLGGVELLGTRQGAILHRAEDPLSFPELPQLGDATPPSVDVPSEVLLQGGWRIRAERISLQDRWWREVIHPQDDFSVAIDDQGLTGALRIRAPKPGDRFRPFGLDGSTKVAEYLMDQGVPAPARRRWPLLCKGGRILWVVGLRMAEEGRLGETSRQALLLKLFPPEGGVDHAAAL